MPLNQRLFSPFRVLSLLALLLFFFGSPTEVAAKVGFRWSLTDSLTTNFLIKRPPKGLSIVPRPLLPLPTSTIYVTKAEIDSSFQRVILYERVFNEDIRPPTILTYQQYRDLRLAYDVRKLFRENTEKVFKYQKTGTSGEGIAIDVPFRIKNRTFKRIFGGERVGLRVSGDISINGHIRRQTFSQIQTVNNQNASTSFLIDQTQRFTIEGRVGEKVKVRVDQDSERLFDFQNAIRLDYTGDEDEIVQSVEAGNIDLRLGTRLATFSGRNQGLFGLKTTAKLGALTMTGIASLEKGQKNKQRPNTAAGQARPPFTEKDFLRGIYFFLSDVQTTMPVNGRQETLWNYRDNYRHFYNRTHLAVDSLWQIARIEVYVCGESYAGGQSSTPLQGTAVSWSYLAQPDSDEALQGDQEHQSGLFRRLDYASGEYDFDRALGYIRLRSPVATDDILAVAFSTMAGDTFGTLAANPDSLRLLLLKPKNPLPTDWTWDLMFRNVYSLNAQDIAPDNFKMEIVRSASGSNIPETSVPGQNKSYLTAFGFDLEDASGSPTPDGKVDSYPALIRFDLGEIHFEDLTPFCPSGYIDPFFRQDTIFYSWVTLDAETTRFKHCDLYTATESVIRSQSAFWSFNTEFRGSRSVYDLGPLVLEGSEEVILNGVHLTRGVDYTIDYMSGQLRILNEAAKAENADLEILYESGTIFQLERKTLLGLRAEYGLWEDSYIGGMWLYLNEKPLERRVRVGAEPIRNTLYDMNTSLKFHPAFLTRAVDMLPLVTTETPSQVQVDAEVARVYPNPNSMENRATGDVGGLAYLDDFESARRSIPLGILRRQWSLSSIPVDADIDSLRGRIIWYNPTVRGQVPVKEVFPERDVNQNVANTLQSLNLVFRPDTTDGQPTRSWGGVMRYLGEAYADQTLSKYLEIWVKWDGTDEGRLVVDIGQVSEDALPDGQMSTEDRPEPGQPQPGSPGYDPRWEYGNGIINGPQEDTGIDGVSLPDPQDSAYWNGLTRPKVPSWDDWNYTAGSDNFEYINGTQGNLNDESGNYPDTEDLNNNQVLDIQNNYFSYDIWLSDTSHYIAGGQSNPYGWRLFRVPLSEFHRKVGNPTMTQIRTARVYMTGMSQQKHIELVQLDIVGNEWQEIFRGDSTERISAAVINNHENPGYESPPGVQGEIDPISGVRTKEQSLDIQIHALYNNPHDPESGEAWIAKNLYTQLNLLEYRRLKMFIHGGGIDEATFPEGQVQLILRIGYNYSDIFNNYYDIVKTVSRDWPDNTIDIAMNDLTRLKTLRDRDSTYTLQDRFAVLWDTTGGRRDSLAIKGNPALSRIGFFAFGVRIRSDSDLHFVRDQEIWVDEFRVSEIYKDPGTAADVNSQIKLADLATVNLGYETRDADFHNVNTRIGDQASQQTNRVSATMALEKFFVGRWGVRLPLSVNYSQSAQTPKYFPNSDFRVDPSNAPDSIKALDQDYSAQISFSRAGSGHYKVLDYTIDRIGASYSTSGNHGSSFQDADHHGKTHTANLSYSLPLNRGTGTTPFFFLKPIPFLGKLSSTRFYYMPTKVNTGIDGSETATYQKRRDGVETNSRTLYINRNFGTGFNFFDPLTADYTRTMRSDLSDGKWADLVAFKFGHTTDINQSFTSGYSPTFFSWMRSDFSYTANYHWGRGNLSQANSQTVSNQRMAGADFQVDLFQLLGEERGSAQQQSSPRSASPPHSGGTDSLKAPGDTTKAPPPRRGGGALSALLRPLRQAARLLDPISLTYDQSRTHAQSATVGQASWLYQFGFTQNPGVDTVGGYTQVPSIQATDDYNVRTGLHITQNIRVGLSHEYKTSSNISQSSTGTIERTVFFMSNKQGKVSALPSLDWTVDWSGLASLPLFAKIAESVSLSNALSGRVQEQWQTSKANILNKSYSRQWNPLLGINITWKGNIDSQIRYNSSSSFVDQTSQHTQTRSSDQQISTTVGYSMRTGFTLPLPFIRKLHLTNQTNISLTFDYRSAKSEYTPVTAGAFTIQSQTSSWNLSPRLTYTFSNAVNGQMYVQMSTNDDKIPPRKSRSFEFGVQVNVSIRG